MASARDIHPVSQSSRRRLLALAVAGLALAGPLLCAAASARAADPLHVCGDGGRLECGRVSVALDPAGAVPGRVRLFVKRFNPVTHPTGTVVALAGGPGQSSIGVLARFITALEPILAHRALVVFDGRGIGRSQPLDCASPFAGPPVDALLTRCAAQLQPRSSFYATTDTASDLEAVRRTLGIAHFTLYGVSYGTLGALDYARAHPQRVDHLILDSIVPPAGDPALKTSTLAAIRRVLAGACAAGCAGLAPLADATALFAQRRLDRAFAEQAVAEGMFDGDFVPQLRSALPALIHLAATRDPAALPRLIGVVFAANTVLDRAFDPSSSAPARPRLYDLEPIATRCEDERFPWAASDRLSVRLAKLRRAESLVPESALAPFDHALLASLSAASNCAYWPTASDAPPSVAAPLPSVPTLILSGEQDVRTPLEDAAALAARLPRATLLPVPDVGHSVLSGDPSGCATRAIAAFVSGAPVAQCPDAPPPAVDPLPPVSTDVLPAGGGLSGPAGRLLTGVVITLRHEIGLWQWAANAAGELTGTEGGSLVSRPGRLAPTLLARHLSYLPGLTIDGSLVDRDPYDTGTISVAVHGSTAGRLSLRADGSIAGMLAGEPVDLSAGAREAIVAAGGLGDEVVFAPRRPPLRPRA